MEQLSLDSPLTRRQLEEATVDEYYDTLNTYTRLVGAEQLIKKLLPHMFARATKNHVEYSLMMQVVARMPDFDSWYAAWQQSGRDLLAIAEDAEKQGRMVTAGDAYLQAALLFHYAQLQCRPTRPERIQGRNLSIDCYCKGAPHWDPPVERVTMAFSEGNLPGYLRLPRGGRVAPCVVIISGANSVKEEAHFNGEYFINRGIATLAFDGPGQGETWERIKYTNERFENAVSAVLDYLEKRPELDPSRFAVFGASTGGYLSARAAARDKRIKAGVSLGGFYNLSTFAHWPIMMQEELQLLIGADTLVETRAWVKEHITLAGVMPKVECPFLILHGARDMQVPSSEAERMAAEAPNADLRIFQEGVHTVGNLNYLVAPLYGDWLAGKLK